MVGEENGAGVVGSMERDWISNAMLEGRFCGSPKSDTF